MKFKEIVEFFFFSDPNVRYVVAGCALITITSSIVGCFTFLRKRALIGDAIAHSVLPGVCIAFLLSGSKNPLYILIGAFTTGLLSVYLMDFITRHSKIKEDTAIGLILSVFFGLGILLLTAIQHSGNAEQSGLDSFIFGKAASIVEEDLLVFGGTSILILLSLFIFFKEYTLITFDKNFAQAMGLPVKMLEFSLTTITVLAVIIGIQAVGVVLMAAMFITPAAGARFWTNKIKTMIMLAAITGGLAGVAGAFVSYIAPAMPTGPWIVIIISTFTITSFLCAPQKGILFKILRQSKLKRKIIEENLLKSFYKAGEKERNFFRSLEAEEIFDYQLHDNPSLMKGLARLVSKGYVTTSKGKWKLTNKGEEKGKRITRLHRLWEIYLAKNLHIASDHVHNDADNIEHVITPELEEILDRELEFPKADPHNSIIPNKNTNVK